MTGPYPWLREALASGAEVVTANKRLARALRQAFDEQQLARGLRTWHTPRIIPWSAWPGSLLERCDASGSVPLRIHPLAAALVWERLLTERTQDRLLNAHGLVRQAQQTWQRLNDWCVSLEDLRLYAASEDERLFADVAVAYRQELRSNGWIDFAQAASVASTLVDAKAIRVPERVVYAGFDRVAPAASRLLHALAKSGAEVQEAPRAERNRTARVISCNDRNAELRAAGLWARRLLEQDPAATVAIVCPGLEHDAAGSLRLVREGFAPGWQVAGRAHQAAVNVSYGRRISEYPLIAVALLWLGWTGRGLTTRDVSVLLRTPFVGRMKIDGRCRLEMALRRNPDRHWRPASVVAALEGADKGDESVDWLRRVERLASFELTRGTLQSPALWAAHIDQVLQEAGWPGERPLDTVEFQVVNRWRDLLNEFSRLDVVKPRIDLGEAVARVAALAAETVFQPETEPGAIQLLGTLEAAGLELDHVWICHVEANQWPPSVHPLPLLSRALQRKLKMPDATPADTLDHAKRVLARLVDSAEECTLSWPLVQDDVELEPSPLLKPFIARADAEDPGWYAHSLAGRHAVAPAAEDPAPPIRPGEKVGRGASVVQRQMTEPFSAFAWGRLGVRDLQRIERGLPASTRGNIIHRALQHLYRDLPSSGEIQAWDVDAAGRIDNAIDVSLASCMRGADSVLIRLLALERKRLRVMLREFLAADMRRQPFTVVAVEKSVRLLRHGVDLDLKIDRIDRLQDGTLVIADYKTGIVKSFLDKNGEPKELQLVVYAAAVHEPVGALVLINVDGRDIVYRGAGGEWNRVPPEQWQGRLDGWKRTVDDALAEIAAGSVRLNTGLPADESRPLAVLSRVEEVKRGG
jgi:ATP-dependent helicase/nuclease subunit B